MKNRSERSRSLIVFHPIYLVIRVLDFITQLLMIGTSCICNIGKKLIIVSILLSVLATGLNNLEKYWFCWVGAVLFFVLLPKAVGYVNYLVYCMEVELEDKVGR